MTAQKLTLNVSDLTKKQCKFCQELFERAEVWLQSYGPESEDPAGFTVSYPDPYEVSGSLEEFQELAQMFLFEELPEVIIENYSPSGPIINGMQAYPDKLHPQTAKAIERLWERIRP